MVCWTAKPKTTHRTFPAKLMALLNEALGHKEVYYISLYVDQDDTSESEYAVTGPKHMASPHVETS